MEELKKGFPDGIDYAVVYDPTVFVRHSIEAVVHTLIEATLLVVLVVIVFSARPGVRDFTSRGTRTGTYFDEQISYVPQSLAVLVKDNSMPTAQAFQRARQLRQVGFMEPASWLVQQKTETSFPRVENAGEADSATLTFTDIEHPAVTGQVAETHRNDGVRVTANCLHK